MRRQLGSYKRESFYRKPNPGMILQAAYENNLDLPNSLLIGDKESDIQAGLSAGVGCNILYAPKINNIRSVSDFQIVNHFDEIEKIYKF